MSQSDSILEESTSFWLMEQLRNKLRELREEAGYTQQEVAQELDKDQVFVSNCESGRRRMDPVELLAFADVYNINVQEFYDEMKIEEAQGREYSPGQ